MRRLTRHLSVGAGAARGSGRGHPLTRYAIRFAALGFLVAGLAAWLSSPMPAQTQEEEEEASSSGSGHVDVIEIDGAITPITLDQIETQIEGSEEGGARALVLRMDTPGGLETSMRDIVKAILASEIPVITYVAPPGARAASAGLFIVTASHVAAMAPNTNLGAASPVNLGGGGTVDTTLAKKAMSDAAALIQSLAETRGRNVDWNIRAVRDAISAGASEAEQLEVIDFVAPTLRDVLELADGRTVLIGEEETVVSVANAEIREIDTSFRHRVLSWLANPNVAYLLLTLGFYGILFELNSPGAILPGVAGAIFIILGFLALQTLPVNVAGLILILLALVFFIVEIKVQSGGILAVGGAVAFLIGSLILFDPGLGGVFRVSISVVLGATLATVLLFFFVIAKALGAQKRKVASGTDAMVGTLGEAISEIAERGQVQIHGEIWQASSAVPIGAGTKVEVMRVDGLKLVVRPQDQEGA